MSVQARGAQGAVTLYTDNDDFFGGHTRSQEPLYSMQGHVIYSFPQGIWASLDATWYAGGRSTLDGVLNSDLQRNCRGCRWRLMDSAGPRPVVPQVSRQGERWGRLDQFN